jgi:hypothetical protein
MMGTILVCASIAGFVGLLFLRIKYNERKCAILKKEFEAAPSQQSGENSRRFSVAREAVRAAADTCNPRYAPLGIKMLAELYFDQGAYLRAERAYISALTGTFRAKGCAHPDVEDCVEKLIKIYRLTGRQDKLQDLLHHRVSSQKGSPKRPIRPPMVEDVTMVERSIGESWYEESAFRANEILSNPFTADKKGIVEFMPYGIACGDYRWKPDSGRFIMGAYRREPICNHERIILSPLPRKHAWPNAIGIFFATFATLNLIVGFLSSYHSWLFPKLLFGSMLLYLLALACYLVYKTLPKSIIHLERRTGMVVFQHLNKRFPFKEMEGCVTKELYNAGRGRLSSYWMLDIRHREHKDYSMAGMKCGFQTTYSMVRSEWEFFQQFMAINLPLPDTPEFEPYRHLDPTTETYDSEHGRPRFYWRNKNDEQLRDEYAESAAIIENFPWAGSVIRGRT